MTSLPLFLCRDVAVAATGRGSYGIATSRHLCFWTRIRALRRLRGSGRNGSMTRSGSAAGPQGTSARACLVARNSDHHASQSNWHTVLMFSPMFQPTRSSIRAPLLEVRPGPTVSVETVALIRENPKSGISAVLPPWPRGLSAYLRPSRLLRLWDICAPRARSRGPAQATFRPAPEQDRRRGARRPPRRGKGRSDHRDPRCLRRSRYRRARRDRGQFRDSLQLQQGTGEGGRPDWRRACPQARIRAGGGSPVLGKAARAVRQAKPQHEDRALALRLPSA